MPAMEMVYTASFTFFEADMDIIMFGSLPPGNKTQNDDTNLYCLSEQRIW